MDATATREIISLRGNIFTLTIRLAKPMSPDQSFDEVMFMRISPCADPTGSVAMDDMNIFSDDKWDIVTRTPNAILFAVSGANEGLTVAECTEMLTERAQDLLDWIEDVEADTWQNIS